MPSLGKVLWGVASLTGFQFPRVGHGGDHPLPVGEDYVVPSRHSSRVRVQGAQDQPVGARRGEARVRLPAVPFALVHFEKTGGGSPERCHARQPVMGSVPFQCGEKLPSLPLLAADEVDVQDGVLGVAFDQPQREAAVGRRRRRLVASRPGDEGGAAPHVAHRVLLVHSSLAGRALGVKRFPIEEGVQRGPEAERVSLRVDEEEGARRHEGGCLDTTDQTDVW